VEIQFSDTVLRSVTRDTPHIVQTVVDAVDPTTIEENISKARDFLMSRGIKNMKPLYATLEKT